MLLLKGHVWVCALTAHKGPLPQKFLLVSWHCATTEGREDVYGLCCSQEPC